MLSERQTISQSFTDIFDQKLAIKTEDYIFGLES